RRIGTDFRKDAALLIIIAQRKRFLFVGLQAIPDGFFAIVFPEGKLCAVMVAYFIGLRWIGVDVVNRSANGTGAAAGEPFAELVVIHGHLDHAQRQLGSTRREESI